MRRDPDDRYLASAPAALERASFGMLTTYPPTPCGIATFSAALSKGLVECDDEVSIVRVGSAGDRGELPVEALLDERSVQPSAEALEVLNERDVAIIQHEFGLYAGRDGDSIIDLMAALTRPSIMVAHTVPAAPTLHQREVLEEATSLADAVVVMTEAGRNLLITRFAVDPSKVTVIPHGAAVPKAWRARRRHAAPTLLTWGLLGPGKGIEWAIEALAELGDLRPQASYRIAGDTHPKVKALQGEAYREMLLARVARAGLGDAVVFDAGYRELDAVAAMIAEASVVILPYDSPDQVTSGVLVDAIAAGCPVISSAFPHAVELLDSGAGMVVPRQDPVALAAAIRRFVTEPGLADAMAAEARRIAPELAWTAVARRYGDLGASLVAERAEALV